MSEQKGYIKNGAWDLWPEDDFDIFMHPRIIVIAEKAALTTKILIYRWRCHKCGFDKRWSEPAVVFDSVIHHIFAEHPEYEGIVQPLFVKEDKTNVRNRINE
jgi:hypothetical protein